MDCIVDCSYSKCKANISHSQDFEIFIRIIQDFSNLYIPACFTRDKLVTFYLIMFH